ncbi:MAG: cation-translocating P-type ATPase [Porcipelethomonas sp.]
MTGLTDKEAKKRLETYGPNTLEEKKGPGALKIFAGQFRDVMVMILLGATVISFILGEVYDAVTIILIVFLNAVLGFVQEFRTEKTLEALRSMTAPTARAYRDGKLAVIQASELVPGDLIGMETGDKVPADCVIISSSSLSADESMLTGESEPVSKTEGSESDRDNSIGRSCIAYSGTVITGGNGKALVIATGQKTQIGRISGMIISADEGETPLQKRLGELGKVVAALCIVICIVVFLAGVIRGEPVFDMLMTGITIAIAAIPEGLPATVTIALALAVNRMLRQKALVNRLHSVETLGCASVICSDKTGTITENKMTVRHIFSDMKEFDVSGNGNKAAGEITLDGKRINPQNIAPLNELMRCSVFCTTASISAEDPASNRNRSSLKNGGEWTVNGDPTETALLICAAKGGVTSGKLSGFRKISEIPFDSKTKMMSVSMRSPSGETIAYIKGAPDILLEKCGFIMTSAGTAPLDKACRVTIEKEISSLSSRALRVIALAMKTGDNAGNDLVFLGLSAMQDPPREEAKEAIRMCRKAHIRTVMITGDHRDTAAAIARQAGISDGKTVITGAQLDEMSDTDLDLRLDSCRVFARVNPSHKLRLVKAYKRKNHIVTMTGDGVNDAPAIKEADVGVAMGITGTDVTKQAADVILLDDNFATLVKAVEQGRGIYANIRKFVRYLLSCNIGEVITMFLGILMGFPMVLIPVQLLLVNLVTDGLPAIALGMEPCGKDVMSKAPRKPDESFFSGGLMTKIIFRGIMIGLCTLGCFGTLLRTGCTLEAARTGALSTLVFSQLIHVFECKSEEKGLFGINYFDNMKLVVSVLISLSVLLAAIYIPSVQLIFNTAELGRTPLLISLAFSFAVPVLSGLFSLTHRRKKLS